MTASVYSAVYSGIPVYELTCRQVAVMRRKEDSYLNATQILKVAGVDKGRRTKILEREVQQGEHEKVQGGYGKYQGTWIPFERGVEVARQYGVEELLRPLFDYVGGPDDDLRPDTPKKPKRQSKPQKISTHQASSVHSNVNADSSDIPSIASAGVLTRNQHQQSQPSFSNNSSSSLRQLTSQQSQHSISLKPNPPSNGERYRAILMSVFLNPEGHRLPELLTNENPPQDLDIDLIIDDQGHTSLHWASALARINVLQLLLNLGADPCRLNFNGESALIRAVLVTNNFDNDTFNDLLSLLNSSIELTDKKGRSLIHHIALTAGIKGRVQASRYYLDTLIDMSQKSQLDLHSLIDLQDKNGDTALNIAARIGNRILVEQLLRYGSDPFLPNKAGLRPVDFGLEDARLASLFQHISPTTENIITSSVETYVGGAEQSKPDVSSERAKDYANGDFEKVISGLEFELKEKEKQINESRNHLKLVSKELSSSRKVIHELSLKISDLEYYKQFYERRLGIKPTAEPNTIEDENLKLSSEVSKLKALLHAHGIRYDSEDAGSSARDVNSIINMKSQTQESKIQTLLSKVLDDSSMGSITENLVDPLLVALESEKKSLTDPEMVENVKNLMEAEEMEGIERSI